MTMNVLGTPGKSGIEKMKDKLVGNKNAGNKQVGNKHASIGKLIKPYVRIEFDPETSEMVTQTNASPLTGVHMLHAALGEFIKKHDLALNLEAQALKAQASAVGAEGAAGAGALPVN